MEILQELNEKQQQAAAHTDGAMLVVAGPGTGKTRVITHRIVHLIRNHQVPPDQILAITFTNKAAQEMFERIKDPLGMTQGLDVRIHTFHAFCARLLRDHGEEIGLNKHFAVFDQKIQDDVLRECQHKLRLNRRDYSLWKLRTIINTYKMKLENITVDQDEIRLDDGTVINDPTEVQNILDLLKAYQTKLASHNALDFDDLISKSVEVLEQVPMVRAKYHKDIRFILVDEYQDVNADQYNLLKLLSRAPQHNIMVVADGDQSIYSWRGSSTKYIDQFKEDFNPTVVELGMNYRCGEKILRAAETVIANNPRQRESILETNNSTRNTIYHYTRETPDAEADLIITLIQKLVKERFYSYGQIAVLYRTHQLAKVIAGRLYRKDIRFHLERIDSFQEEHAQGILSYLNFTQWKLPRDIEKAVNFPQQLIDDLTLVRLKWLAQQQKNLTLTELLRKIDDYPADVGPLTRWNVRQFFQQIDDFSESIEGEQIHTIAIKLFDLLSHKCSPYQSEDIHEIENQPEIPGLRAATDSLYSAIDRGEPIRLMASYGVDSYCAAHIISSTLERYLDLSIHTDLLPVALSLTPTMDESGVNILIGDFGELPERQGTTILLGSSVSTDANVIQLNKSQLTQSRSVTALKLCQRLLSDFEQPNRADMIIYDLETTSDDPNSAEIIQLGAVSAINDELENYKEYVKPPHRIPKSSTRIHNINNETVANKPGIETVLPQFLSFIQDHILIGHNIAEFDKLVLDKDLKRCSRPELSNPYYDTLVTARRLYPRESCSLEALANKFNITPPTHNELEDELVTHDALEDALVTRDVFNELIKEDLRRREVRSLSELLPLVGIGILAAQQSEQDPGMDEGSEGGIKAYRQAAARYVRAHRPELDWLNADLQSTEKQSVQGFIDILTRTQIEKSLEDRDWEEKRAEFMNNVLDFERNNVEKHLTDFLDYQKLINSADEMEVEVDKITLMTLHAAKGTEFPVVIIMGLEDGTFPMRRKGDSLSKLEEERRLFYVGMTRTQERLYLTSVTHRGSDYEREHSMFLDEIPSDLIEHWHRGMKRKR